MCAIVSPESDASSTTAITIGPSCGGVISVMKSRVRMVSMMFAMRSVPGICVEPKGAALLSELPRNEAPSSTILPANASPGMRPASRSMKE